MSLCRRGPLQPEGLVFWWTIRRGVNGGHEHLGDDVRNDIASMTVVRLKKASLALHTAPTLQHRDPALHRHHACGRPSGGAVIGNVERNDGLLLLWKTRQQPFPTPQKRKHI